MTSALSTTAVLKRMAEALPSHQLDDEGSDLASSYEAIALLIHAYLSCLDFRLCGFDQDRPVPECESLAPQLPPQWNAGFGSLSFVYKHKQSSMQFVIRVDRMGGKVEVRGLAVGDEHIHRFERTVREVIQSSHLPVRIAMAEHGQEDRSHLVDNLRRVFVSDQAISDILNDLKVKIVQKLVPKLQKEGYVETADTEEIARSERRAQEMQSRHHPLRADPPSNLPYPHPHPLPEVARPRPGAPVADFPPPASRTNMRSTALFEEDPSCQAATLRSTLVMMT